MAKLMIKSVRTKFNFFESGSSHYISMLEKGDSSFQT